MLIEIFKTCYFFKFNGSNVNIIDIRCLGIAIKNTKWVKCGSKTFSILKIQNKK